MMNIRNKQQILVKTTSKNFSSAVVNYSRQDLTKKWMNRINSKAKDAQSQEAFQKLSSLVDYYNKPAEPVKENIDWNYWTNNIRTEGIVDKIKTTFDSFKKQSYNVDNIAQKSAKNSENYDHYGLFLKWNYELWMTQYLENVKAMNSIEAIGDISYVTHSEMFSYNPGIRETAAAWRETGHYLRTPHYYENSTTTILRRQFRYSNRSWIPYWHSVGAWERGLQIKHVLMSL